MKRLVLGVLALAFSGLAAAQPFPTRPLRLIVPFAAGGGADIVARLLSVKLQESLGQPVSIDNRPGASEIIGMTLLTQSPPDGYTMLQSGSTLALNPMIYAKLPYDTERDIAPIAKLLDIPLVLVVNPSVTANTTRELVQLAKSQPGKLNYGHIGDGSVHRLAMEWFKSVAGIDVAPIAYKGVAPAGAALISGEIQMILTGLSTGLPQAKAGKMKAIAVTTPMRVAIAPDLPTVAETYPEIALTPFYAMVGRAGTPADILNRLSSEIAKALNAADVRERLAQLGLVPSPSTPAELANELRVEAQLWARLVKLIGLKPQQL